MGPLGLVWFRGMVDVDVDVGVGVTGEALAMNGGWLSERLWWEELLEPAVCVVLFGYGGGWEMF